jgi:hypothetical protein
MNSIALTKYGECFNAWCRAPLFVELAKYPRDLRCFDCSPVVEMWADIIGNRCFDLSTGSAVAIDALGEVVGYFSISEAKGLGRCLESGGRL